MDNLLINEFFSLLMLMKQHLRCDKYHLGSHFILVSLSTISTRAKKCQQRKIVSFSILLNSMWKSKVLSASFPQKILFELLWLINTILPNTIGSALGLAELQQRTQYDPFLLTEARIFSYSSLGSNGISNLWRQLINISLWNAFQEDFSSSTFLMMVIFNSFSIFCYLQLMFPKSFLINQSKPLRSSSLIFSFNPSPKCASSSLFSFSFRL